MPTSPPPRLLERLHYGRSKMADVDYVNAQLRASLRTVDQYWVGYWRRLKDQIIDNIAIGRNP